MTLKLTHIWKATAGRRFLNEETFDAEREAVAVETNEKQAAEATARREHDQVRTEKKEREDREWLFFELILAGLLRTALENLQQELADARKAVEFAYTKALEREREAISSFSAIRDRAVVLEAGSRGYFTSDGRLLREDGKQIIDSATVALAQEQRSGATTFEEFMEARAKRADAAREVEGLDAIRSRLDDLERRAKFETLTAEELAAAKKEAAAIVDALPAAAREEYERLQAVRRAGGQLSYRAVDPQSAGSETRGDELQQTKAVRAAPADQDSSKPERMPIYRPADF